MYEDDAAAALCRSFSAVILGVKGTYCGKDQVVCKDGREQKDCQGEQQRSDEELVQAVVAGLNSISEYVPLLSYRFGPAMGQSSHCDPNTQD